MSQQRWAVNNGAAFALSTSAKTILNLIAGAADRINALTAISVSVDTSATIFVELCESTQGAAGTAGTAPSVKQVGGFSAGDGVTPGQVTFAGNYTAEPTTLTRLMAWRFVGPGPFYIQFPLGRGPESLNSGSTKYKALALRLTASTGTPNADATVEFE